MTEVGIQSFGELARTALKHPDWPKDSRAQPRSLEAIFGRLDRREDLEWLGDRPGVQQVLSSLFRCETAEIRAVLINASPPKSLVTRLKLDTLPSSRPIDFQKEALPPTIPERIGLPSTWRKMLWLAPSGAGFSLVRHWLQARGLAQTHLLESIEDFTTLPQAGLPLFVEVEPERLDALLPSLPTLQPLCIAVSEGAEVDEQRLLELGFEVLKSSPVAEQLPQIVDWVLARSVQGSLSKRDGLLAFLDEGPKRWNAIESLGDALGYIGVYLTFAPRKWPTGSKEAFLRWWLTQRSSDLTRERLRDKSSMVKLLPDALIDIAQGAILDDTLSWLAPRLIEDWLALVPPQHQRGPDLDWLSTQAHADPLALQARDIERAAKRLPPGAHRIIVALRELGLLLPWDDRRFALRPHFVARLVQSIALDRVAQGSPLFWGEALLRSPSRSPIISALANRVEGGADTVADDLLEVVEAESAPLVCALETGFVLIGLETLAGGELSESNASALLDEQNSLLLTTLGPLPLRRTVPSQSKEFVDSDGAFYLAAFALSEFRRQRRQTIHPLLDPWNQLTPPNGWGLVLDAIAQSLRSCLSSKSRFLGGAIRMLDRIRQTIGAGVETNVRSEGAKVQESAHSLFQASVLLDAVELTVLDAREFCELLKDDWQFELLLLAANARQISRGQLSSAVWTAFLDVIDDPSFPKYLSRLPRWLFSEAPPEVLAKLMCTVALDNAEFPWETLAHAAWVAWSKAVVQMSEPLITTKPWQHVPTEIGETIARALGPVTLQVREMVWQRWPQVALDRVEVARVRDPNSAVDWLTAAPITATEAIATATLRQNWHRADNRVALALLRCLQRGLSRRAPGWLAAYECIHLFETERLRYQTSPSSSQ